MHRDGRQDIQRAILVADGRLDVRRPDHTLPIGFSRERPTSSREAAGGATRNRSADVPR
jgi:hypothetical protein